MIRGVPYDAEVEYIGATAVGPWLKLPPIPKECAFDFSIRMRHDSGSYAYGNVFGQRKAPSETGSNSVIQFIPQIGILDYARPTGYRRMTYTSFPQGEWHEFEVDGSIVKRDGVTISSSFNNSTQTTNTYPNLGCFASCSIDGNRVESVGKMSVARFSYKVNGVTVFDGIPVRVGSGTNAVGYMYDRVSGKLFGNAGTGKFTIGPDVATPVMGLHFMKPNYSAKDYVQDGLVAMRDAVWNVAGGKHDSESLVWNDIVDGTTMTVNGTWGDDYLLCNATGNSMYATYNYGDFEDVSMTLVYDASNYTSMRWMISGVGLYTSNEYEIDIHDGASSTTYASGNIRIYGNQAIKSLAFAAKQHRNSITVVKSAFNVMTYSGGVLKNTHTLPSEGQYNYTDKKFVHGLYFGGLNLTSYRYGGKFLHHCIYSRALTAEEIALNYAIDKERFNLPEVSA